MNAVPPSVFPAHHHDRPEGSGEALPDFFREMHETARSAKPDTVVEFGPRGTAYSFFPRPHFNFLWHRIQKVRFKSRQDKTLKTLMGDYVPYFGDHVELSDGRD
jgi:alpha-galactosidase